MRQPSSQDPDGASSATAGPACEVHGRGCTAICARCGDFTCPGCLREVRGQGYCPTCVAAGHAVDYLARFRSKRWGKRDGWAWLVGLGAVLGTVALLGYVSLLVLVLEGGVPGLPLAWLLPQMLLQVGWISVCVAFFLGLRWSRPLLLGLGVVDLLLCLMVAPPSALLAVLRLALIALILANPGTRLFFRMEVSERALRRMYLATTNRAADLSVLLAVGGFLTGGVLGVAGLLVAVQGLRKVDLQAVPPVGGTDRAIAGLLLSGLSLPSGLALLLPTIG